MNDNVTLKNVWRQSVNFIKKSKEILPNFHSSDLKIIAYLGLLIYWSTMLTATFLQ